MTKKNGVVIPTLEEIVDLNKKMEKTSTCDKDKLNSILAKVKAKRLSGDLKKDVASIASILWYEIIVNHPFLDGNKRTATGITMHLLKLNGFTFHVSPKGLIYISLKIANKDISHNQLLEWVKEKLVKLK